MAKKKPQPPYLTEQAPEFNLDALDQFVAQVAPQPEKKPEGSSALRRALGDTGIALLKGAIGVPEAVVGMADLFTGGAAGKLAEDAGFRAKDAKAYLDTMLTPEQQAANREVQQADGFMGKLGAAVTNPSVIAQTVAESLPSVGAGGVVARGALALAPRMAPVVAGAVGEGAITAGQGAEQVRQETPDGLLTGEQAALMGVSGAVTGGLSLLGGKIAQRLGIGDIDTLAAGAARAAGPQKVAADAVQKGVVRKVLEGAVSEGILEELPQSVQEQVLQNAAQGKPLDEGVDYAAVMGLLSGGVMGAAAAPFGGASPSEQGMTGKPPGEAVREAKLPEAGPMTRAVNAAVETAAKAVDAGAPIPPEPGSLSETGSEAPPAAPPAIDFERVLANMHQWAAEDAQKLREWDTKRSQPAQPAAPAAPMVDEAPQGAPMGDILNPDGAPFKNRRAAQAARSRQADPGAFDVVPVDGGFAVRPTTGFTTDATPGADEGAGTADRTGVSGTVGMAERAPDGAGAQADARPAVDGAAQREPADGLRPGGDGALPGLTNAAAPAAPSGGGGMGGKEPPAAAAPSVPVAGQKIDAEWTAFAPESGTKGVPRADMPQIKAGDRSAMVQFLRARGIDYEADAEIPAASLKPTQAEFSPGKVAKAREFTGGDRSILVSQDGHVLDGHHQWLQKLEDGQPVKAIVLKAPIDKLLAEVREFPSAAKAEGATAPAADPAAQWDALTPEQRRPVLERAGWAVGDRPSKSSQAMMNRAWDKMSDSQRQRLAAALSLPGTESDAPAPQPAAEAPRGEAPAPAAAPAAAPAPVPGAGAAPVEAGGVDAENALIDAYNAAVREYRAAGEAGDKKAEAAALPRVQNARKSLDEFRRQRLATDMRDFRQRQAEATKQTAAAEAERLRALPTGQRLRPSEHAADKGLWWEKTGPDEWTGRGEWFQKGKTRTSAQMADSGGMVEMPPAAQQAAAPAPAEGMSESRGDTKPPVAAAPASQPETAAEPEVTSSRQPLSESEQKELDGMLGHNGAVGFKQLGEREWRAEATGGGLRMPVRATGSTQDAARRNLLSAVREAREKQAQEPATPKPSANTVFTEDAAAAARARLKAKLGRLNSGIDPEMLMDGITLAGYHVEKGARTFAAYARAMVEDLGDAVKPYLQSWYMAVRSDPRAAEFKAGMDKASTVEDLTAEQIDALLADSVPPAPAEKPRAKRSLQEQVERPAADDEVVATVGDPQAEGERKFYVTIIRGDRVARLAGPFDTKEQAEAMLPRAQDEANKADPRSAFDAFGVSAVTSKNHKPGTLNDRLGIEPTQPGSIQDVGEKIGGARKDRWKERGLDVSDLDAMSESEGATHATKANVWKPDYEAMADAADPVTAAMVKVIYDGLAAKPKADTPQGRRDYVQAMQAVRKVFGSVKTVEEAKDAYMRLREELGVRKREGSGWSDTNDPAAKRVLFSVYKGRSDPFVFDYNRLASARALVKAGFPNVAPWKRRFVVREHGGAGITPRGVELVVKASEEAGTPLTAEQVKAGYVTVAGKTGGPVSYHQTKADAEAAAAALYERTKGSGDDKAEPERPHLDKLVREGLPQRLDRDVTAEDFRDTFGWRGVEFGNWAAQDERQRLLNMAYDGLMDLADILGVPPKALSLNGTMGLAFGARGGGRFAAHYEPGKMVINMTKLRGAGSLAHEWAHALDHYLGELDRPDAYQGKARGASGWYSQDRYSGEPQKRMVQRDGKWVSEERMRLANLRPELAKLIDGVMKRLYETPLPQEEAIAIAEAEVQRAVQYVNGEKDPALRKTYEEGLAKRRQVLADLQAGKPSDRTRKSSFAAEAQKLSGKAVDGYWTRPTEMFARAFESYVFDRLVAMGARSDYLVHGVEQDRFADGTRFKGNPYPSGDERKAIGEAFDAVVGELKTREGDDGNVVLFSRMAPEGSPEANALQELSRNDDLFALNRSDSVTVKDIARDIAPGFLVQKVPALQGTLERWKITAPDGSEGYLTVRAPNPYGATVYGFDLVEGEMTNVYEGRPGENPDDVDPDTQDVYIDVSKFKTGSGGSQVYAIAGAYAHNTGRIFIGDPAGLSDDAMRRRSEAMLSLALRYGTTDFLAPHPRQTAGDAGIGVPALKWVYGDTLGNIRRLIDLNVAALDNAFPDASKIDFDPSSGEFLNASTRVPIDRDRLAGRLKDLRGAGDEELERGAAGSRTVARSAVWRSLAREESSGSGGGRGRDGLLARLALLGSQSVPGLKQLFSRARRGDGGGLDRASAQRMADDLAKRGVVRIRVVKSVDDMPAAHREKVLALAPDGRVRGAYFRQGDSIYAVADNIRGADEFVRVVLHEAFHRGLARTIPAAKAVLRQMHRTNAMLREATAEQVRLHGIGQDEAIEEALAVMAEDGRARDLSGFDKLLGLIRDWLAKLGSALGLDMKWTDDMVLDFIAGMTREGLTRGVAVNTVDRPVLARAAATDTDAFKRWFGDSKVVDAEGKPLVVYHGTRADFDSFEPSEIGKQEVGIWLTNSAAYASRHTRGDGTRRTGDAGPNVMPVYVSMKNPKVMNLLEEGRRVADDIGVPPPESPRDAQRILSGTMGWDTAAAELRNEAEKQGHDGLVIEGFDDNAGVGLTTAYIAFRPEQIKSAIGNRGTFDPAEADVTLSRMPTLDDARAALTARNVADQFDNLTRSSKAFNWWHRTVGTQMHKARVNADFRRVYDAAQAYLHDTSAFANDAADLAPDLLPQLKTLADAKKPLALPERDRKALAAAVFDGTLNLTRDDSGQITEAGDVQTAGVVFTPEELRERYGFDDRLVKLYQQFRASTNRSLDILVAADVARLLGEDMPPSLKAMISQGDTGRFRGLVTAFALKAKQSADDELAAVRKKHRNEMARFWRKQREALAGPRGRAGSRLALQEELDTERNAIKLRQGGEKYRAEQEAKRAEALERDIREKYERVDDLKARGYAPLMRFGRYTVDVLNDAGEREFFGMFESERKANAEAKRLGAAFPDASITQGILSEEAYKQFSGMTPETVELFAELAGVEKTPIFEEYLRRAKNNRSALKRLIKRQGIAGYSADVSRVLASFLTSNGRAASSSLHMGDMARAAEDIPKSAGDVKDEAMRLVQYVQNPQEEAAAVRGLLFAQYLGGSVASAMVNMTQPLMMTLPYLSQFGGPVAAARRLATALKATLGSVEKGSDLARALALAEKEGIVSPQEMHQLQSEVSRTLGNNPKLRRFNFLWGSLFALAEQFNRRLSFIAAFNTAKETGTARPFDFAVRAVEETQGVYNKCVDGDTEILTAAGWKRRQDLVAGEAVFGISPAGHVVNDTLLDVHHYPGEQAVLALESSTGLSIVTTPNHEHLVQSYSSRDQKWQALRRVRTDALKQSQHLLRAPLGDGLDRVETYTDDQVRLLAWVAAEGNFFAHRGASKKRGVGIVQSLSHNPGYVAEITDLLDRLGGHYNRKQTSNRPDTIVTWQLRKPLWAFVHEALPEKRVTMALAAKLTVPQMRLFLETFTKGDGHFPKDGGSTITQKRVETLHTLQAMAVLTGQTSTVYERVGEHDVGALYVAKNSVRAHRKFMTAEERTVDGVWCPQTTSGAWIARRNGRTFVTGNSNRPNWARGAIGSTVFTFKQYSVSYLEFLKRLPPRERALALAILIIAAGAQGAPGADDLDDIIDTFGQHMGYDTNAKLWKTRVLSEALGDAGADFVLHGFSALPGVPLDVSGRLGLGNLIPGTGMLLKSKTDKAGEVAEAIGPIGSTVTNAAKALPALFAGEFAAAHQQAGTTATKNLGKAIEMYLTGEYRDMRGRKVRDVDALDAFVKGVGFQPAEVARDSRQASMAQQQVNLARVVEGEIAASWAQGVVEGDAEKVRQARERLADWNRENPASRIGINGAAIARRVREMRMTRDQRLVRATPREMRQGTAEVVR